MRSSGRGLFSMLRLLWVDEIIIISRNDDNNDAFLLIYLMASLSFFYVSMQATTYPLVTLSELNVEIPPMSGQFI